MKRIYVSFPFPYDEEYINPIEEFVKKETNISISIKYHDWDDDNQTGYFDIEENNWKHVVKAIHDFGDAQCFHDEPTLDVRDGKTYGWLNCVNNDEL